MRPRHGGPRGHTKNYSNDQRSSSSTGTFVSTISDCWNNPTTPAPSSSQPQRRTICQFCPSIVVLPNTSGEQSGKLQNIIGVLCNRLQISRSELPQRFTREMFPFCTSCESLMEALWKQNLILEDILKKMKKTVYDIEHAVVDSELIKNSLGNHRDLGIRLLEKRKYIKLRDLVLKGYREKLFRNYVQNPIPNEDDDYLNVDYDDEEMREPPQYYQNEVMDETIRIEENQDDSSDHVDQLENVTISVVKMQSQNSARNNEYSQSPNVYLETVVDTTYDEQGDVEYEEEEQQQDEQALNPEDPYLTARYNERNCTLVIPTENAELNETSVIQIKQEVHAHLDADVEQEDSDDIFHLAPKKRRFLFEGIEIYRANGTGKRSKLDYLQCSSCIYTLPIQKNNKSKASSPYMKMKTHILHIHKKKSGTPKAPRAREHMCVPCNLTFDTYKDMRDHKAEHPSEVELECDICGKRLKSGTSQYNLLIHKFSHKNDEERLASIAAGERGSYNCMLSTKLNMGGGGDNFSTPEAVRKRNNQRKAEQRARKRQAMSVSKDSGNTKVAVPIGSSHACNLCGRMFGRKCHLERHRSAAHNQPSTSTRTNASRAKPNIPMMRGPILKRLSIKLNGRVGT